MEDSRKYMSLALDIAAKGWGYARPNPMVGAVVVKDNRVIGQGWHQRYGGPHAEVNALSDIKDARGAEMYVTLEPCSHYGKTPPCAKLLIEKGIKKVIAAMGDPNPLVSGRGFQMLRDAGIEVEVGIEGERAKKLNEIFLKYITNTTPFVIMKSAITMDGKIASKSGHSQWITGSSARQEVHRMRKGLSSIMVGINTVLRDDPMLTTRLEGEEAPNPIRIVVDSSLKIPQDCNLIKTIDKAPVMVATTALADSKKLRELEDRGVKVIITQPCNGRVDLKRLMGELRQNHGIDSLLLEGGGELNWSMLENKLVDKFIFFMAPLIVGGQGAPGPVGGRGCERVDEAFNLRFGDIARVGRDIMVEAYPEEE